MVYMSQPKKLSQMLRFKMVSFHSEVCIIAWFHWCTLKNIFTSSLISFTDISKHLEKSSRVITFKFGVFVKEYRIKSTACILKSYFPGVATMMVLFIGLHVHLWTQLQMELPAS